LEKLQTAIGAMKGESMIGHIDQIFAVYNPILSNSFESHRSLVAAKQNTNWSIFLKKDYDPNLENIVKVHDSYLQQFPWNQQANQLKISMMAQGTRSKVAWDIVKTGFAVLSSPKDEGWFGKGIYTTSSMQYASGYAHRTAIANQDKPALLICAAIPGNIYPMNETQEGISVRTGYQSHFTIVDLSQFPSSEPLLNFESQPNNAVDELVLFQEAQLLPMFIVELRYPPPLVKAISTYATTHSDELSFNQHEIISIEEEAKNKPGWWIGANQSGEKGLVPAKCFKCRPPFLDHQGENVFLLQRVQKKAENLQANSGNKLTRAEFKKLDTDQLLAYFAENNLKLSAKIIDKIREQEIDGDSLTNLTAQDLITGGFTMGMAGKIMGLVPPP